MPRIMPDDRYFSMPSTEVGADVRRNRALNCWPWVRSFTHSPDAVIHSPAAIVAAWPTTVTRSRCPRAFARRTQKPFSALWKVTRSTSPASTSWVDDSGFMGIFVGAAIVRTRPSARVRSDRGSRELVTIGWLHRLFAVSVSPLFRRPRAKQPRGSRVGDKPEWQGVKQIQV